MKNNPNQNANSGRLQSSWDCLRGASTRFHGRSFLPKSPPSKSECVNTLMDLPPRPSRIRVSEAGSTFQFRKVFPATFSTKSTWEAYSQKLSSPSPSVDPRFKSAVDHALRLLGPNWDRSYRSNVNSTVPSMKANYEGLRPASLAGLGLTQDDFRSACLGHIRPLPLPNHRRVKILNDCGKARIITIAPLSQLQLRPLHVTLYDALVKHAAVLRGNPTSESLSGFTTVPGEFMISGDYTSATDGFNMNNTLYLLRALRATSSRVPDFIWDLAEDLFGSGHLEHDLGSVDQRSGQLMGNYLSFPLLCLTNLVGVFVAFGEVKTLSLVRSRRLLINGDDILFQGTKLMFEQWCQACPLSGLSVSLEKTLVHPSVMTINSNFFMAKSRKRPRHVWIYRAKSFVIDVTKGGMKPKLLYEKKRARLDAVCSVIKDHLELITNSKKRGEMRNFFFKVHRKKLDRGSLSQDLPDERQYKAFIPAWRRLANSGRRLRNLKPKGELTCVQGSFANIMRSHIVPVTRDQFDAHRYISQAIAWGREKVDTLTPDSFTYNPGDWGCPRSFFGCPAIVLEINLEFSLRACKGVVGRGSGF